MLYDISSGSLKLHLPFPLIILEIFFVYLEFFYFFNIDFVFVLEDNLVSMDVSQTQIILTTYKLHTKNKAYIMAESHMMKKYSHNLFLG